MITIVQAGSEEQLDQVRSLMVEYFEFLRKDVDNYLTNYDDIVPLAGYDEEMAGLPGRYAPPDGRLLLAQYDGEAVGCVAFYKFGDGVCELKRLWTRPPFRGKKIGRALVEALLMEARKVGYSTMLLSTVDILKEAQALYQSLGFVLTAPYFDGPEEMMAHEVFMRLDLTR